MKLKRIVKNLIIIIFVIALGVVVYFNYDAIQSKIFNIVDNGIDYMDKTGLTKLSSDGKLIANSDVDKLEDSGITGEDVVIDTNYYPYYRVLNNHEQLLYRQIYANIKAASTTFVPEENVTVGVVNNVIEAVYNDHPELFWMDTSYTYKYTEENVCAQVILKFNETANYLDTAKENFENEVSSIIANASRYSTSYEKEKAVHDAIIDKTEYNETAPMNQTAYSALVNGKTVCAGYARAFQYIMMRLNIPTYYVTGISDGDHAWNIVKLEDGFYNVDLTWDDNKVNHYIYFNIPDSEFSKTHTRTRYSTKLPNCTGTKYVGNITPKTEESNE